jgi:murein DD-endopeptidase MepM/ murein hydrolase activator NlpD
MSTESRGRHRAARHAAPKKKKAVSGKHLGALVSVAGMSSVVATSGSTVAGVTQSGDTSVLEIPTAALTASDSQAPVASIQSSTSRAQAASRSEDRQTLAEAEVVAAAATVDDPTSDPNAVIDTTPTVSGVERKSLQALAASTDQLGTLISQAQDQKNQQAQILLAEQQSVILEKEQAEAALVAAEKKSKELERQEQARKQAVANKKELARQLGVITEPIESSYQLSARYGQRGGIWSGGWHTGLDFRVRTGTPVVAAANGTIIAAGWEGSYGYRIQIDHGSGYITTYNHLSKIIYSSGEVAAGQEIGRSGNSGNTTGPHLHFEVTKDGEFINPSKWLWGN